MIPVDSAIKKHDPANGQIGDCHRAVIASLLELPLHKVPHFFNYPVSEGNEKGLNDCSEFLKKYGLRHLELPFTAGSLKEAFLFVSTYTGDGYYTLTAGSKRGNNHIVICKGNNVVHDPTYGTPHGIVAAASDGYWWFGWLVKL